MPPARGFRGEALRKARLAQARRSWRAAGYRSDRARGRSLGEPRFVLQSEFPVAATLRNVAFARNVPGPNDRERSIDRRRHIGADGGLDASSGRRTGATGRCAHGCRGRRPPRHTGYFRDREPGHRRGLADRSLAPVDVGCRRRGGADRRASRARDPVARGSLSTRRRDAASSRSVRDGAARRCRGERIPLRRGPDRRDRLARPSGRSLRARRHYPAAMATHGAGVSSRSRSRCAARRSSS